MSNYRLVFASPQSILSRSHGECITSDTFTKGVPTPRGLLCERLFGPMKEDECQCGQLSGRENRGRVCKRCGVIVGSPKLRWSRFAHISLPFPIVNPIAYPTIAGLLDISENLCAYLLHNSIYWTKEQTSEGGIYIDGVQYKIVIYERKHGRRQWPDIMFSSLDLFYLMSIISWEYIFSDETSSPASRRIRKQWQTSGQDWKNLFLTVLPVLPPMLRQETSIRTLTKSERTYHHSYTDLYRSILFQCEKAVSLPLHGTRRFDCISTTHIQREVYNLFWGKTGKRGHKDKHWQGIFPSLTKKNGWVRQHMMGKRVDFSSRAVITPDPSIHINQIGLPYKMAYELLRYHVIYALRKQGMDVKEAFREYRQETKSARDILEVLIHNQVVLFNRQPTLFRHGMQAFTPILTNTNTIGLHPLLCGSFAADYDGDSCVVHLQISPESQREAHEKMRPRNNMFNTLNSEPLIMPSHEMIMGLFYMTSLDENQEGVKLHPTSDVDMMFQHGIISYRTPLLGSRLTTYGRICIQRIFRNAFFIDIPITKNLLRKMINEYYDITTAEETLRVCDELKNISFEYITTVGFSIGMDDMRGPTKEATPTAKTVEDWLEYLDSLEEKWLQETPIYNPVRVMLESGSRISKTQTRQLVLAKGIQTKRNGEPSLPPVLRSLSEGLSPHEYWQTCSASRRAMAAKKTLTWQSGYLLQKLVHLLRDFFIVEEDCQTKEGILFSEKDTLYRGRTVITGTSIPWFDSISAFNKPLRTPIYCQSYKGICQKCYGQDPSTRYAVEIGTPIGIRSAQALCEVTTQTSMAQKHTSGVMTKRKDIYSFIPQLQRHIECSKPKYDDDEDYLSLYENDPKDCAKRFIEKMLNLYEEESVYPLSIHIEMIFAGLTSLVYNEDSCTYGMYYFHDPGYRVINGATNTIRRRPSWLSNIAFGYTKDVIQRAAREGQKTYNLSAEKIMRGYVV